MSNNVKTKSMEKKIILVSSSDVNMEIEYEIFSTYKKAYSAMKKDVKSIARDLGLSADEYYIDDYTAGICDSNSFIWRIIEL